MKKKVPDMPVAPPEEDEVERHNAYHRINPIGDKELVVKRNGRQEATLSELAQQLLNMLESVEFTNMPAMAAGQDSFQRTVNGITPQLVKSNNDQVRAAGDTITNMGGSTPLTAEHPDQPQDELSGLVPDKYISGQPACDIYHESFMGTGAIAIAPTGYQILGAEDEDQDTTSEYDMPKPIVEWQPEFERGEYDPGDYQMPSPGGKGVVERKPSQDKVGKYDTDMTNDGEAWPRDHNETVAMCDVDDDGVEHKPQGSHESTHGDPSDGHQSEVGHDWPDEPHNSGQGVAEPFGGSRWEDGGTLTGSRGPGSDTWTNDKGPGMPSDGSITGTSGPQLGQMNEWGPEYFGAALGEDLDLQALFDNFARKVPHVCVEDFQRLCDAHHLGVLLDESSLLKLMDANQEFMFYENADANGPYWTPMVVNENRQLTENRRGNRRTINELQVRSPEDEAGMYTPEHMQSNMMSGAPEDSPYSGDPHLPELGGGADEYPEMGGMGMEGDMQCPGCGYTGPDEACPECGEPMEPSMGGEESLGDPRGSPLPGGPSGWDSEAESQADATPYDDDWQAPSAADRANNDFMGDDGVDNLEPIPEPINPAGMRPRSPESQQHQSFGGSERSPGMHEGLTRFMGSAKAIVENSRGANRRDIAEALNHSWAYYAGNINARRTPPKVRETIGRLCQNFPGFRPVCESGAEVMGRPDGTKIGGGGGPTNSEFLPNQPKQEKPSGDKKLLNRTFKNGLEGTPTIPNTAKGLNGTGGAPETVHESKNIAQKNIARLSAQVKKSLLESAKVLVGKHNISFSVVVTEGKKKNATPKKKRLSEALADAEEILLFHSPQNVSLQASFHDASGHTVLRQDVPLFTIAPRGPLMAEGKTLFRFARNAEAFADVLVSEGVTCRIHSHNWGNAVEARTRPAHLERAFAQLLVRG